VASFSWQQFAEILVCLRLTSTDWLVELFCRRMNTRVLLAYPIFAYFTNNAKQQKTVSSLLMNGKIIKKFYTSLIATDADCACAGRCAAVQHERGPRHSTLRRDISLCLKNAPAPPPPPLPPSTSQPLHPLCSSLSTAVLLAACTPPSSSIYRSPVLSNVRPLSFNGSHHSNIFNFLNSHLPSPAGDSPLPYAPVADVSLYPVFCLFFSLQIVVVVVRKIDSRSVLGRFLDLDRSFKVLCPGLVLEP